MSLFFISILTTRTPFGTLDIDYLKNKAKNGKTLGLGAIGKIEAENPFKNMKDKLREAKQTQKVINPATGKPNKEEQFRFNINPYEVDEDLEADLDQQKLKKPVIQSQDQPMITPSISNQNKDKDETNKLPIGSNFHPYFLGKGKFPMIGFTKPLYYLYPEFQKNIPFNNDNEVPGLETLPTDENKDKETVNFALKKLPLIREKK